jgi:hypothetical protein
MSLTGASGNHVIGFCRRAVLRPGDDPSAEDDRDFLLGRTPSDGFEARLLGGARVEALHVALEPAHQKQKAHDDEGPREEHDQQKHLIRSHWEKCRRP